MAFEAKRRLIRALNSKGYERENVLRIFKFIDWVLRLPKVLEVEFWHRVRTMEGKKAMPYLPSYERYAVEIIKKEGLEEGRAEGQAEGRQEGERKGLRDGLIEGIAIGLKLRFGPPGLELLSALGQVTDADVLRRFHEAVLTADTIDQLRGLLPRS